MAWLKREEVDEEIVKVIEYRYLNTRGYPIDETSAKTCKVTEYDAEGNVIREAIKLCLPYHKIGSIVLIGYLLVLFITGLMKNFELYPSQIFIIIRRHYLQFVFWSYFTYFSYIFYRVLRYKERYLVLWKKGINLLICYYYMFSFLMILREFNVADRIILIGIFCEVLLYLCYLAWDSFKRLRVRYRRS